MQPLHSVSMGEIGLGCEPIMSMGQISILSEPTQWDF